MTAPKGTKTKKKSEAELAAEADEAERSLARNLAYGLPAVTWLAALGLGLFTSIGPALLVIGAGALLGTIALLWASLRTLGGDAPLPAGLASEAIVSRTHRTAEDRKRAVLLALKDLEHERAIGKIDDEDYKDVAERYRAEAKQLLKQLDDEAAPNRARAEKIARAHLAKRGLGEKAPGDDEDDVEPVKPRLSIEPAPPTTKSSQPPPPMTADDRATCAKCGTSNETDAAFCKKCGAKMGAAKKTEDEKDDKTETETETEGNDDSGENHADS